MRLAEEVCEAEVVLDDGELTLIALNGLNASYDAFVTTEMPRADDITFAAFQGLLQVHEDRYSRPTTSMMILMANVAQGLLEEVIYQICQKRGHTS